MVTHSQLHEDIVLFEAYSQDPALLGKISTLRHVQQWAAKAILPGESFAEKAVSSIG